MCGFISCIFQAGIFIAVLSPDPSKKILQPHSSLVKSLTILHRRNKLLQDCFVQVDFVTKNLSFEKAAEMACLDLGYLAWKIKGKAATFHSMTSAFSSTRYLFWD
jgi:hypothetical protein